MPKCLAPRQAELVVEKINHTDHSITLQLPNPERYPECENISLASVEYTVYYGQIRENQDADCSMDMNFCIKLVCHHFCNCTDMCLISQLYFLLLRLSYLRTSTVFYNRNGKMNFFDTGIQELIPQYALSFNSSSDYVKK